MFRPILLFPFLTINILAISNAIALLYVCSCLIPLITHTNYFELISFTLDNSNVSILLSSVPTHVRSTGRTRRLAAPPTKLLNVHVEDVDPISIAVDWVGNNLYWIDSTRHSPSIMMSDLDGKNIRKLITNNLNRPLSIVLDALKG